ncbi:MAG: DUF2281 domain-containing protein [Chloroflexota bacterium]|nr:DUF2281 domain-containing protein [Chloroflexota bacterium]
MRQINLDEAKERLPDLIDAVIGGETVFIVGDGGRVAQLVPVAQPRRPRRAGSAKGLIWIAEDLDEPLEDRKE